METETKMRKKNSKLKIPNCKLYIMAFILTK